MNLVNISVLRDICTRYRSDRSRSEFWITDRPAVQTLINARTVKLRRHVISYRNGFSRTRIHMYYTVVHGEKRQRRNIFNNVSRYETFLRKVVGIGIALWLRQKTVVNIGNEFVPLADTYSSRLHISLSLSPSLFFSLSRYIQCIYTDLSLRGSHIGASGTRNFITASKFRSFAESANVTRDVLRFNPIYNEKSKGSVDFSIFVGRFGSYSYKAWTPVYIVSVD